MPHLTRKKKQPNPREIGYATELKNRWCCAVPCGVVLCCAVLFVMCRAVLSRAVLHCCVLCCVLGRGAVLCCAVLFSLTVPSPRPMPLLKR